MFFFNRKDAENWESMFGIISFIFMVWILFGCSAKVNINVTDSIRNMGSKPIIDVVQPTVITTEGKLILDPIDKPMNINFGDDSKKASRGDNIYIVSTWATNGECLRRIANQFYGNEMLWPKIYNANRDIIKDPDLIYPGQRLVIP